MSSCALCFLAKTFETINSFMPLAWARDRAAHTRQASQMEQCTSSSLDIIGIQPVWSILHIHMEQNTGEEKENPHLKLEDFIVNSVNSTSSPWLYSRVLGAALSLWPQRSLIVLVLYSWYKDRTVTRTGSWMQRLEPNSLTKWETHDSQNLQANVGCPNRTN